MVAASRALVGVRPASVLTIPEGDLDLGHLWAQDRFACTVRLANTSDHEVEIADFRSSCACVSVEPRKLALAAGETTDLHLLLDLTGDRADALDRAEHTFSVDLSPVIERPPVGNIVWQLRGRVSYPFTVTPAILDFGDQVAAGASAESRFFQLSGAEAIVELSADCPASLAHARIERQSGGVFRVVVTPRPDLLPGRRDFVVRLHGTTTDGGAFNNMPLRVRLHVSGAVVMRPHVLNFGRIPLGETRSETVVIRARHGAPIQIERFETSSPGDLRVEEPIPRSGSECHVTVQQRASVDGNQRAVARFWVGFKAVECTEVELPVHYYGVARDVRKAHAAEVPQPAESRPAVSNPRG